MYYLGRRAAGICMSLIAPVCLQATIVTFNLDPHEGAYGLDVLITVDDGAVPGKVKLTADLLSGAEIGDITKVFMSGSFPVGFGAGNISGTLVTSVTANAGMPPLGTFDWGVGIGNPGIGHGDDHQQAILLFDTLGSLTASDFSTFGARVQSIGPLEGDRNRSAKFFGDDPVPEVPEPGSFALLCGGLGLLALGRLRLRRN